MLFRSGVNDKGTVDRCR